MKWINYQENKTNKRVNYHQIRVKKKNLIYRFLHQFSLNKLTNNKKLKLKFNSLSKITHNLEIIYKK